MQSSEQKKGKKYDYKTPKWLLDYKELFLEKGKDKLNIIENYLIYNDCVKPFCLKIDSNGKRHFPNHAEVSYKIFLKYCQNDKIANLIKRVMLCHITKPKDYELLTQEKDIEILLL